MGARSHELGLRPPPCDILDKGKSEVRIPNQRKTRSKNFRRLNYGAVPGYAPLSFDRNDPETIDWAFRKRLMGNLPETHQDFDQGKYHSLLREFESFVKAFVSTLPEAKDLSLEEWLSSTSYNESRKRELRNIAERLKGGRPTKKQASHVDSFVKNESYPCFKFARMINSRSDWFKVYWGPMCKAIEDVVYQLPEFIKHVPVRDRPSKIAGLRKHGRRYFATDFTAFESHFTSDLMNICECELYRHCFSHRASDAEFVCKVLCGTNRMRTRTGIHARCQARRMSGDMNTSLGNGFTNLMLAKFLVARKGGVLEGFVEGDDGIFSSTVEITAKDYAEMNFTIKINEVSDPCEASFCGMIFAGSGEIIRDANRFMQNFGWTGSFVDAGPRIMDELLHAKILSALNETPQCPIVSVLARKFYSKVAYTNPRFVEDGYHDKISANFVIPPFNPSMDTRLLYEKVFGVSVSCQLQIENFIDSDRLHMIDACLFHPEPDAPGDRQFYIDRFVVPG